jgi:mRNA interferase MazF
MARRDLTRGDIRWYRFSAPDKRRPVLVLGGESLLRSADQIPVIPFSTQIRGLVWEVRLNATEGLVVDSVLKPEWIRSVSARELDVAFQRTGGTRSRQGFWNRASTPRSRKPGHGLLQRTRHRAGA